jgi:membrane associated rhomboid family serine protease
MFKSIDLNKFVFKVLIANVVLYIISLFLSEHDLVKMYGFSFYSEDFNIIQSLTSMFLHGGFSHLFFNMLVLLIFGYSIEEDIGTKKIIFLYLISGLSGWFIDSLIHGHPSIGSSGAVSGIMASTLIIFPKKEISLFFLPFKFKLKWLVILYFIVEIFKAFSFSDDGISHFCHIGGFIGGYLYTLYLKDGKMKLKF